MVWLSNYICFSCKERNKRKRGRKMEDKNGKWKGEWSRESSQHCLVRKLSETPISARYSAVMLGYPKVYSKFHLSSCIDSNVRKCSYKASAL